MPSVPCVSLRRVGEVGIPPNAGVAASSSIPPIGIGTYELRGDDCVRAVSFALRTGFRLVDTAAVYRNEALVGEGIRESGVPREELFVVVKIAMKSMCKTETLRSGILESIERLGIGYADAVLVHWPGCGGLKPEDAAGHSAARRRCWQVMHELQLAGQVRSVGASNFLPRHFEELHAMPWSSPFDATNPYVPALNQIELHPLCAQPSVVAFCRSHGMVLQQYSPLGKGDPKLLQHPALVALQHASFPDFSIADVCLLWGLSQGFVPLVRSHKEEHLMANWRVALDFFAVEDAEREKHGWPTPRRPLSATQRELLQHLREHVGMDTTEEHLCWNSETIAILTHNKRNTPVATKVKALMGSAKKEIRARAPFCIVLAAVTANNNLMPSNLVLSLLLALCNIYIYISPCALFQEQSHRAYLTSFSILSEKGLIQPSLILYYIYRHYLLTCLTTSGAVRPCSCTPAAFASLTHAAMNTQQRYASSIASTDRSEGPPVDTREAALHPASLDVSPCRDRRWLGLHLACQQIVDKTLVFFSLAILVYTFLYTIGSTLVRYYRYGGGGGLTRLGSIPAEHAQSVVTEVEQHTCGGALTGYVRRPPLPFHPNWGLCSAWGRWMGAHRGLASPGLWRNLGRRYHEGLHHITVWRHICWEEVFERYYTQYCCPPSEISDTNSEHMKRTATAFTPGAEGLPLVLVSSCLLGEPTAYHGGSARLRPGTPLHFLAFHSAVWRGPNSAQTPSPTAPEPLLRTISLCPEMHLLGLPAPRPPIFLQAGPSKGGETSLSVQLRSTGKEDDSCSRCLLHVHQGTRLRTVMKEVVDWNCAPQSAASSAVGLDSRADNTSLPDTAVRRGPPSSSSSPDGRSREERVSSFVRLLEGGGVHGALLKARSPSCGVADARVYTPSSARCVYTRSDGFFTGLLRYELAVAAAEKPIACHAALQEGRGTGSSRRLPPLPIISERQLKSFEQETATSAALGRLPPEGGGSAPSLLSFLVSVGRRYEAFCGDFAVAGGGVA
eukprot:gene7407-5216_t